MNTMDIVIESGIPIPDGSQKSSISARIRSMKVGDSFKFPITQRSNVSGVISHVKKAGLSFRFTTRKIDDSTCRIWRTA